MAVERGRRAGVRGRTTIAATLVVGAALAVGSVALESVLRRSLVSDIQQVAELRAADVAALVRHGRLPSGHIGADEDEAVQVVDGSRRVVAASANLEGRAAIAAVQPAGEEPVARTVGALPGIPGHSRLVALTVPSPTGRLTVYVATSLSHADETLLLLRTSLFVGVPLLLGLVAATTWAMVGRALGPVESIRSEVADISRRDLGRRVPVPAARDEVGRLAETMNDMLDRVQAAFEQQRRFVADASHELRTPLAAVRADLEVALAHPGDRSWTETAHALLEENLRMERLVADLLFIARADDDGAPRSRTPVDLHEVVLAEVARVPDARAIAIDTAGVAGAFVLGRRDDLARVVRNLLDNAERHAASSVHVALRAQDGTVTLTVEDDGPGVGLADRERIFERFTRLDDSRNRVAGGTGLGLAIVREIAEQHGGSARVCDGNAGGARFEVSLPAD
jgi:signal transduction histidine kinase